MPRSSGLGLRFFFYGREGEEPPHIHVEADDRVAKFWLLPVTLVATHGFRPHEIGRLHEMIVNHREDFLAAWRDHLGRER